MFVSVHLIRDDLPPDIPVDGFLLPLPLSRCGRMRSLSVSRSAWMLLVGAMFAAHDFTQKKCNTCEQKGLGG